MEREDISIGEIELFTPSEAAALLDILAQSQDSLQNQASSIVAEKIEVLDLKSIDLAAIASSLQGITDPIGQIAQWMYDRLREAVTFIVSSTYNALKSWYDTMISPALSALHARLSSAVADFMNTLSSLATRFSEGLAGITSALSNLGAALSALRTHVENIISANIASLSQRFSSTLASLAQSFASGLASLSSAVSSLWSVVRDFFTRQIPAMLSSVAESIRERISSAAASISSALGSVARFLGDAAAKISQGLASLGEMLKGVGSVLTGFVNSVLRLPEMLYNAFRGFLENLLKGLAMLAEAVIRFMVDPLGTLRGAIDWLAAQLWNLMPEDVRAFFSQMGEALGRAREAVGGFLAWAGENLRQLAENPQEWLQNKIVTPFFSAMQWLWQKIVEGAKWLWEQLSSFTRWVAESAIMLFSVVLGGIASLLTQAGSMLVQVFYRIGDSVRSALTGAGEAIMASIFSLVGQVSGRSKEVTSKLLLPSLESIFKSVGVSSPQKLTPADMALALADSLTVSVPMMMLGYGLMLPVRAGVFGLRGVAATIGGLRASSEVEAGATGPLPEGRTKFRWSWTRSLSATLFLLAREIDEMAQRYARYSVQGLMIWYGQAMSKLLTLQLRNHIPLAVPDFGEISEVLARASAAEVLPPIFEGKVETLRDYLRFYMAISGYSDVVLSWRLASGQEFALTVRDRFSISRTWPLALWYVLPSASTVAEWFVRDLFYSFSDFMKAAKARGLSEDIAAFYFFSTFKYPSPESLARFYWRGVSGVLWLPTALEDPEVKQTFKINYPASAPAELNFNVTLLREMMSKYLRWHDRAPVPWAPKFPTDRAITMELMAELPTMREISDLVRWGISEHLAILGFSLSTPPSEIPTFMQRATGTETFTDRIVPEISLDVTSAARLIEARGLHPNYVPAVAVALSHRVLTREMTLLRTGFLNLYRHGLSGLLTLEKMLSGLLTIKFKTGYYDPNAPTPEQAIKVFEYKKPLFWLPAERRLIELRAVMDRADALFRSLLATMRRGVRSLVLSPLEARKEAAQIHSLIAKLFAESTRALTGKEIPLEFDESYFTVWMAIEEQSARITKATWLRRYASRLLPWMLYRVAYGWVKPEDVKKLGELLVVRGWLTPEESEFFFITAGWMLELIKREYTVSPSTLATLAEYIDLPDQLIDNALKEARIPPDMIAIWKTYIRARTVKSDYRRLLTAARRALRRGALTPEEYNKILAEAPAYGFTLREIKLEEMITDLELRTADVELYPSLSVLVQLAEYVDIPLDYVKSILQARKLEPTYAQLWLEYFRIRPVSSEVNALVSTYRRIAESFAVPEELARAVESLMSQYGWTRAELDIFKRDLELRKALRTLTWLVPTIRQLVGDSLYIPDWERVFEQVLSLRGVDVEKYRELVNYYKRLATSRHVMRHLSWYRTRLAAAYAYGVIDETTLRQKLEALKEYGLSDREIDLIVDGCKLYRAQLLA